MKIRFTKRLIQCGRTSRIRARADYAPRRMKPQVQVID